MCRFFGMQGSQLFESADLVNGKTTSSIVTNLITLQGIHERYSKSGASTASSTTSTASTTAPSTPSASTTTANAGLSPRPASQSVSAGSPRADATPSTSATPSGTPSKLGPTTPRKSEPPAPIASASTPDDVVRTRVTKPKPDDDRVAVVQRWIEELLSKKNNEESLFAWLKSGVILCEVLNAIKADTVKQIYEGPVAFKQMENVQRYLKVVPLVAGPTVPVFSSADMGDENNFNPVVSHLQAMISLVQRNPKWTGPILAESSDSSSSGGRVEAAHAALASPRPAEKPAAEPEPEPEAKKPEPAPVAAQEEKKVEEPKKVEEEKKEDPKEEKKEEPKQEAEVIPPVVVIEPEPEVKEEEKKEEENKEEETKQDEKKEEEQQPEEKKEEKEEAKKVEPAPAAAADDETKSESSSSSSESSSDAGDDEPLESETAKLAADIVVADLVLEPESSTTEEEKLDLGSSDDEKEEDKKEEEKKEEEKKEEEKKEEPTPAAEESAEPASAGASATKEDDHQANGKSEEGERVGNVSDLKSRPGYVLSDSMLVNLAKGGKAMNRVAAQDELVDRVREILEDLDGRKPKSKVVFGRVAIKASADKLSHMDTKSWTEEIVAGKWSEVSKDHRGLVVIACITEETIPDHVGYPSKDVHRYARDMAEDMLELASEDPDLADLVSAHESLHKSSHSKEHTAALVFVAIRND